MKQKISLALGIAALLATVLIWRCQGRESSPSTSSTANSGSASTRRHASATTNARPRTDPSTLVRGSIAGTITAADTKAPIAGARACARGRAHDLPAELLRDLACAVSDAEGRYQIDDLLPARYEVSAAARTFRPTLHHPGGDRRTTELVLLAGERETGVDIALQAGGVEVTGSVSDVTGGPVARARVWVGEHEHATAVTDTDEHGTFSLWVAPGYRYVSAVADGYGESSEDVQAPGTLELFLTPESTLAGTVVDAASGQPVPGARVTSSEWGGAPATFTDDEGTFRITRLAPGRVVVIARTDRGYGRTEGSTLVGLGQHVDGVIVKLFPAARVEGIVQVATTHEVCADPEVTLHDIAADRYVPLRGEPDGRMWAEGVLPGTYKPSVSCRDYRSRDKYDPVVVANAPVTGLVWEVDPGAVIRGKIVNRRGEPIADAGVWARMTGGAARDRTGFGSDESAHDGSYELTGLRAGSYKIDVDTDKGLAPKDGFQVDVADGAVVDRDLVLEAAGTVTGSVVDADGKPVGGIDVNARLVGGGGRGGGIKPTDDSGAFTIQGLRAGDYRVTAQRGWSDPLRKPGTTDDAKQGEKVSVRAGQVATVRLVVESLAGTIAGTVVDAAGAPVSDAFVSAARESDAAGATKTSVRATRWRWDEKPVITDTDGGFTITKLAPGAYTIRAYRRGGGEAVAEHVQVGDTAKLQITPTGSIEGIARRAGAEAAAISQLEITLQDVQTGFWRDETFYMTGGRFVIRDLPKGTFRLSAESAGARTMIEVALAEGETRTGVTAELEGLVTLTGQVVDSVSGKPVPGIRMFATPVKGGGGFRWSSADESNITDDRGAFTIEHAPAGKVMIRGMPKDWSDSDYETLGLVRTPEGTDLGALPMLRKRVKQGDAVGQLGVNFADPPPGTAPDERIYKVSWIDPDGPAAKTELAVGDIVTTIDGVDITGASSMQAWSLMRAPPGAKIVLGLERGAAVTVTLAAP